MIHRPGKGAKGKSLRKFNFKNGKSRGRYEFRNIKGIYWFVKNIVGVAAEAIRKFTSRTHHPLVVNKS